MQTNLLSLTPSQAAYLQRYLPVSHSFQVAILQTKRARAVKKIDDSFTTDFVIPNQKRQNHTSKATISDSMRSIDSLKGESKEVKANTPIKRKSEPENHKKIEVQTEVLGSFYEATVSTVLGKLKMHKSSWPFRNPVNPDAQGVPNYLEVIREPMDLKTIQKKIKSHSFKSYKQFDQDVKKIIANSYTFNSVDTIYYALTKQFETFYQDLRMEFLEKPTIRASPVKTKQLKGSDEYQQQQGSEKRIQNVAKKKVQKKGFVQQQKEEIKVVVNEVGIGEDVRARAGKELTFIERERLFNKIQKLGQSGIKKFLRLCGVSLDQNWNEIEVDFTELSEQKFQKLQMFLSQSG